MLVYRSPTEPASKRVAIWRDLKCTAALHVQQCVCILPDLGSNGEELERVMAKVSSVGGETVRFVVPRLESRDEARIQAFREQRTSAYAELIEECETKFQKEIECEHFRENYTFEEVEEIEQDLDKIRRWYDRIKERDWFRADRRDEVEHWIERCQELMNGFVEEVYKRQDSDAGAQATGDEFDKGAQGCSMHRSVRGCRWAEGSGRRPRRPAPATDVTGHPPALVLRASKCNMHVDEDPIYTCHGAGPRCRMGAWPARTPAPKRRRASAPHEHLIRYPISGRA